MPRATSPGAQTPGNKFTLGGTGARPTWFCTFCTPVYPFRPQHPRRVVFPPQPHPIHYTTVVLLLPVRTIHCLILYNSSTTAASSSPAAPTRRRAGTETTVIYNRITYYYVTTIGRFRDPSEHPAVAATAAAADAGEPGIRLAEI